MDNGQVYILSTDATKSADNLKTFSVEVLSDQQNFFFFVTSMEMRISTTRRSGQYRMSFLSLLC